MNGFDDTLIDILDAPLGGAGCLPTPWNVSERDFPWRGGIWQKLSFCLNYAILAPSIHNTQPWRFGLGLNEIKLYADRTRALPVADPCDRQLLMSCGAALFHLRLAIRFFGSQDLVWEFPNPEDPDLLARIQIGHSRTLKADEGSMFHAIAKRRTFRGPFDDCPVPDTVLPALTRIARSENSSLTFVTGHETRQRVGRLIALADRVQMSNPSFRRELAAWIHSSRSSTRDGIPGYAIGYGELVDFATPALSLAVRTFDLGRGIGDHDRELAESSPILAVLSTTDDTPAAWLAAGQAMAAVLLLAHAHGLSASFLNQPLELGEIRPELGGVLALTGFPQTVMRLGYGHALKPTPRRELREMLL